MILNNSLELVTFGVADIIVGMEVCAVREINRNVDYTPVPHAPSHVRGVLNLRGEVVTSLDLREILGLRRSETDRHSRHVILSSDGEQFALLVDRVEDVVLVQPDQVAPPPDNFKSLEGRFFTGICKLPDKLVALINVSEVLAVEAPAQAQAQASAS